MTDAAAKDLDDSLLSLAKGIWWWVLLRGIFAVLFGIIALFAPGNALFPRFPSSAMYDRVAELGPRHLEILELVLSGCTNQEISDSMHLSLGTVKNYVSSLLLALDVKSRSHMVSLFR